MYNQHRYHSWGCRIWEIRAACR